MNVSLAKKNKFKTAYTMNGKELATVDSSVYLGVTFTSDLKWNKHIQTMTSKANKILNFLRRNLRKCPKLVKEKAYLTYVRPITEYASTVWDPHTKENIDNIEKIQRRAARFVTRNYQQTASVTDMITKLKWPPLQERRLNANLFMFYRIAYRTIAIPATYLPPLISQPYNTRKSHHLAFQIPQCRINCYRFSFLPRIIRHWNTLPQDIASATTIESLKLKLSDYGKK
jgi:hypothetical protein